MPKAGIRELKANLSAYLHQVETGETIVITRRGKPIGRILPMAPSTETQLEVLRQAGVIAWDGEQLQPLAPVAEARGETTVSDLLLENRE